MWLRTVILRLRQRTKEASSQRHVTKGRTQPNVYHNSTVPVRGLQAAKYVSRECTGSTHFRKYASDVASVEWDSLVSHNAFRLGQRQHPMETFTNVWACRCWPLYFHEWKIPSGDLIIIIRLHMKNVFSQKERKNTERAELQLEMQVNQWHVTFIVSLKRCLKWIIECKSCTANLLTYLRVNVMIKHLGLCSKPPCSKGKWSGLPEWMQIFILGEHFGWRKCDLHKIWSASLCVQQGNIPEAFGNTHYSVWTERKASVTVSGLTHSSISAVVDDWNHY